MSSACSYVVDIIGFFVYSYNIKWDDSRWITKGVFVFDKSIGGSAVNVGRSGEMYDAKLWNGSSYTVGAPTVLSPSAATELNVEEKKTNSFLGYSEFKLWQNLTY